MSFYSLISRNNIKYKINNSTNLYRDLKKSQNSKRLAIAKYRL